MTFTLTFGTASNNVLTTQDNETVDLLIDRVVVNGGTIGGGASAEDIQRISSALGISAAVPLVNVAGTANAITATIAPSLEAAGINRVTDGGLFILNPVAANTAQNPTITVYGTAYGIRGADGGDWPAGGFVANRTYILRRLGATMRVVVGDATSVELSSIRDGSQMAGDGTVLIAFRNGRAALVQKPDGLDFVASQTLRDSVTSHISSAVQTTEGIPVAQYRDGRVAIMQKPDGLDFVPSAAFVARLPIRAPDPMSGTRIQLSGVNGQSHSIGGPWDSVMTLARAMGYVNRGCLQLTGTKRTDGAEITHSMGPGQFGYDRSVPATGLTNAVPGTQQIGLPFATFAMLNAHRADLDLPQIPVVTGAHGIGGIPIDLMDDDPATGNTSATTVWDSFTFWHEQAMAQAALAGREVVAGWHVFNHGGAGKKMLPGEYAAEWLSLQRDSEAFWTSLGMPQPRYIVTQTGGETNTTNDSPGSWSVVDDQLDLVEAGCAVLGSCDYWYPVWDNEAHWDAHGTALAGETLAWAMSEVEAGRQWSIMRPRVVSHAGGVLVLSFDSLREDEKLEVENPGKYSGEGIDAFLGFQMVGSGATIAAVDVTGRRVAISYSGAATGVKYALQIQDVSGYPGNKFTAHRGLLRTSLRKKSKFLPDEWLVRAIPSFTLEL